MSVDPHAPQGLVTGRTLSATALAETVERSDRERIAEAALQFEAMFLLQMLKQMRQSMLQDENGEPGLGASTMFDTIDSALATGLARQGTGLARVLVDGMARAPQAADTAASSAAGAAVELTGGDASRLGESARAAATTPAVRDVDAAGFAMPVGTSGRTGTVSSAFGWRRDPLNGTRRFHAGVDLRGAYGSPVSAAAGGRVVFAGEQGGYGQSVVIEHAPGLQTRYAHLSGIEVRSGEVLAAGAHVGRVGSSGRATGPHLHFEVLAGGRRVDPATAASRLAAALKLQRGVADSPTGTPGAADGIPGADE